MSIGAIDIRPLLRLMQCKRAVAEPEEWPPPRNASRLNFDVSMCLAGALLSRMPAMEILPQLQLGTQAATARCNLVLRARGAKNHGAPGDAGPRSKAHATPLVGDPKESLLSRVFSSEPQMQPGAADIPASTRSKRRPRNA